MSLFNVPFLYLRKRPNGSLNGVTIRELEEALRALREEHNAPDEATIIWYPGSGHPHAFEAQWLAE